MMSFKIINVFEQQIQPYVIYGNNVLNMIDRGKNRCHIFMSNVCCYVGTLCCRREFEGVEGVSY